MPKGLLTVGKLKEAIKGAADDMPVCFASYDENCDKTMRLFNDSYITESHIPGRYVLEIK